MKDFQQKKMAFRITLAKEMARRGMSYDEIALGCKPTAEDYRLLQAEIDAEYQEQVDEILDVEWYEIKQPETFTSQMARATAILLLGCAVLAIVAAVV